MTKISLKIYPDRVLRKKSTNVERINDSILSLIHKMEEIMNQNKGIGLAAPQVGINKRLFITKDFSNDNNDNILVFINPEIIEEDKEVESKEGCLSIPGHYDYIKRKNNIFVSYTDLEGAEKSEEFNDMQSIVYQHELDHLDGILFPDRLPKIRKDIFFKKIDKEFKSK